MSKLHDEKYWSNQFDVTQDHLNGVADRLAIEDTPQDLREIALDLIREQVEPGAGNANEQAEGILLKHGERILSLLAAALAFDPRFTGLEDKWFLLDKLPRIEHETLQKVYRGLLQTPSSSVDEILSVVEEARSTDQALWKMALHTALRRSPERFENRGTPAHPQWKARLPGIEQAEVTHYAYDPQTYEILCRPGQRLSEKKAKRLQELNLYMHVVTFAESHSP
jgi:hypothetical protein